MTQKKPDTKEVATWMLVGFKKCWTVREVFDALSYRPNYYCLHDDFPMFHEYTSPRTPVRAVVSQNFPKLADVVERGIKTKEQADAAINFLSSAVARNRTACISQKEGIELRKDARKFRADGIGRLGHFERNNIGKHGWKVCK